MSDHCLRSLTRTTNFALCRVPGVNVTNYLPLRCIVTIYADSSRDRRRRAETRKTTDRRTFCAATSTLLCLRFASAASKASGCACLRREDVGVLACVLRESHARLKLVPVPCKLVNSAQLSSEPRRALARAMLPGVLHTMRIVRGASRRPTFRGSGVSTLTVKSGSPLTLARFDSLKRLYIAPSLALALPIYIYQALNLAHRLTPASLS